jgi:K+-transporting ATPase ATPase C chain
VLFAALSLITGVVYPLAITGIAQLVFPRQANGSLIVAPDGRVVGSSFIGQEFASGEPAESAKWFWGRPSATGPVPYTALNTDTATGSSGSNLAPSNPALIDNVKARLAALAAADATVGIVRKADARVPIDLVTASASGLDPHISPAAAEYQVPRVAKARGLPEATVREVIARHSRARTLGVLGEAVVNVLGVNLELAEQSR